jgi:hypothetical protein
MAVPVTFIASAGPLDQEPKLERTVLRGKQCSGFALHMGA